MQMSDVRERDRKAFKLASEFLEGLHDRVPTLLPKYLRLEPRPQTLPELYGCILESAKNANMRSGVIEGGIGGVDNLKPVLFGFDPVAIASSFTDWEKVLDKIVAELRPKGQIRRVPKGIWPQFCKTVISAAAFLTRFKSADEFYSWADMFRCNERAHIALPVIIANEIYGLGFALACDFVKELGYEQYPKPDVQLDDIFKGIGLSRDNADEYELFYDIIRVAKHSRVAPYHADKVFWLIGSGWFYLDGLDIGSHKKEFISHARRELGLPRKVMSAKA